jgi:hypothetical protein
MSKSDHAMEMIGERLRGYRVVMPTPELKERVLGAARGVWKAAPVNDIPWTMPLLRFAASLLAAAIPVFVAHTADSSSGARFTAMERESAAVAENADLWATIGRSPFVSPRLRAAATREPDATELLTRHLQALAVERPNHRTNGE